MTEFQRLSRSTNWVIGSIESDTGSEYLFGYDRDDNRLIWLERSGAEYSPSDAVWSKAQDFVRQSFVGKVERSESIVVKTVKRSTPYDVDMGVPVDDVDERVVGHIGTEDVSVDVSDDDIAAQAAAFLDGADLEDADA